MFEVPDGRINGLHEAQQIIRARYIGTPSSQIQKLQFLTSVTPREFEHIVERLYSAMGYNTHLTPPKKDGGRDIVAKKEKIGALEHLLIECKQYTKPVGVEIVRALLGVVSDEKVNKGVLVTTSTATKGTREFKGRNPRLELIEGKELIPLLNEYLGGDWPITIDGIIADSQRQNQPGKHAD
jgi:restriction system protein